MSNKFFLGLGPGALAANWLRQRGGWRNNVSVYSRVILAAAVASMLCICAAAPAHNWDRARPRAATSPNAPSPEQRIDINYAGMDQLMKVPGMTRIWAARIVRFRPYRTKADLLEKGIVTGQVYARIKDYLIAHRTGHY